MRRKRRESFWVERKEMKDDTILWANLFSSPLFSFLFRMDFSFSQRRNREPFHVSNTSSHRIFLFVSWDEKCFCLMWPSFSSLVSFLQRYCQSKERLCLLCIFLFHLFFLSSWEPELVLSCSSFWFLDRKNTFCQENRTIFTSFFMPRFFFVFF